MEKKNTRKRRQGQSNKAAQTAGQILPAEKTQAIQQLINITNSLTQLGEREAQALAQNDMLAFSIIQDEKALMAEHYANASKEFRVRLAEFRSLDKGLVERLANAQNTLGAITAQNNMAVEGVYERTKTRTKETLDEAGEISKGKRIAFDAVFANENGAELAKQF